MKNLEQLRKDLEVVRAEIEDAIEKKKPMSYIQALITHEITIKNRIMEQSA